MKSFYFFLLIAFLSVGSQAQTLTFKTSSVSVTEKNDKGKWNNWSEFVDADLIITIDGKKNRIVVNSPDIQVFTIKAYGEKIENDDQKIVPFECVDNNGSKCNIIVITHKKENNRMQFYINYSEVKFVYNIYN
ncbi:hypothetical protein [Flavobacterium sp.]|uniref:hypothetical protein n=1 Tax=Flavobacterium sp. TaxID=239 RepID=UPI002B4ACCF5|nr:hypothetical protein [Flavobacterium sp.]HLP63274.1 hypothetical protein [Flavobacterium sp.]